MQRRVAERERGQRVLVVRIWDGVEGSGRYAKEVFFDHSCHLEEQECLWCRILNA